MRTLIAPMATLVALAAAGCGAAADSTADFEGEERKVATVVEDLQDAAARGEERRICRQLLAADLARRTPDCNATVSAALDDSDSDELAVKSVRVSGETARAEVATGTDEDQKVTFELVRESGDWRVSDLGG